MQTLSARDAKYNFGRLIDTARSEPVTVEKHGRAVVVVLAVEEYERLKAIELERHENLARSGEKMMRRDDTADQTKTAGRIEALTKPADSPGKVG